jgi:lipase maturation factor 1
MPAVAEASEVRPPLPKRWFRRWYWVGGETRPTYFVTRWLFLRALAIVYLIAFWSLSSQVLGLIGSKGIYPARETLILAAQQFGSSRYHALPTLCWIGAATPEEVGAAEATAAGPSWFGASDGFLRGMCIGGIVLSIALLLGLWPPLTLTLLWIFYLSLVAVGRDFLSFQWDVLLLETTVLAIFFSSGRVLPKFSRERLPSGLIVFVLYFLLFRLMFSSGVVKLQDDTWRDLTALTYHYWTQPLPTGIGWYLHQLPLSFHKFSVLVMFGIELAVPFFVFGPRFLKPWVFWINVGFHLLIVASGNFTFFNHLAIVLCIPLLDDAHWRRLLPRRLIKLFDTPPTPRPSAMPIRVLRTAVACLILFMGVSLLSVTLDPLREFSGPGRYVYRYIASFHIVNTYGLFANMTTERPELIVEGSNDQETWTPYEFKWKPGDPAKRPRRVAPHQPRLDWQMWFAALQDPQRPRWYANLVARLLTGSPDALALFEENPFPDGPPTYIRTSLYKYRFTTLEEKRETGDWWRREFVRHNYPVFTLRSNPELPEVPEARKAPAPAESDS